MAVFFNLVVLSCRTVWDVEENPYPNSVDGSTDLDLNSTVSSFDFQAAHFSVFHSNIQSILPKRDLSVKQKCATF